MAKESALAVLAEHALFAQNACNLSAVVHQFSRDITQLRRLLSAVDTDTLNRHPISVMYASKIASLTGCEETIRFGEAYEEVQRLSLALKVADKKPDAPNLFQRIVKSGWSGGNGGDRACQFVELEDGTRLNVLPDAGEENREIVIKVRGDSRCIVRLAEQAVEMGGTYEIARQ